MRFHNLIIIYFTHLYTFNRDNSDSEYHERKYLIQPKLTSNYKFSLRNAKSYLDIEIFSPIKPISMRLLVEK